ncbi:hypothetical protein [Rhodoplanes serenus]|uniref:hypothetical protein n=1 Tax=Rhodoplanes serenus TaxID=200615 RepID=UPI000DAE5B60|nr:hypothetical protein [Rhodoplanes serenus]RAI34535.1 hypothetical protein CH340_08895 [Rhodoplanes serenus]
MRIDVTNKAPGIQGVSTASGTVYIPPGVTRSVDMTEEQVERARRFGFLALVGAPEQIVEQGGATAELADLRRIVTEQELELVGLRKQLAERDAELAALRDSPADQPELHAVHRGRGSYSIMRGTEELVDGLTKADADQFNALPAEDKAAFVAAKD